MDQQEQQENSSVTLMRKLKERVPYGATLLIRQVRKTGYGRSYRVYTVVAGEDSKVTRLNRLNPALLALGSFERDEENVDDIFLQGTGFKHAQALRELIGNAIYDDEAAFTYELL